MILNKEAITGLIVGVLAAVAGTQGLLRSLYHESWNIESLNAEVITLPKRSGRLGLTTNLRLLEHSTSNRVIDVYFDRGGHPKHPLSKLKTKDHVYFEGLIDPLNINSAIAVHLVLNGEVLFSKDNYLKRSKANKIGALIITIVSYSWLLYQFKKHYFHYRHLKSKRRFNIPV